jgi:hypothetical protein
MGIEYPARAREPKEIKPITAKEYIAKYIAWRHEKLWMGRNTGSVLASNA